MRLGIIGLPNSGKTTIFNALTGQNIETTIYPNPIGEEPHIGMIKVPDKRIDRLSAIFKPKKTIYADVRCVDITGFSKGISGSHQKTSVFNQIWDVDAIIHVVRAFDEPEVAHPDRDIDPVRDASTLELELIFNDLELIEKRLERIAEATKKGLGKNLDAEKKLLTRCNAHLEDERPLRNLQFSEDELKLIRPMQFASLKPELVVLNVSEKDIKGGKTEEAINRLREYFKGKDALVFSLCGKIEMELSQMPQDEAVLFLSDLGIEEPAMNMVIKEAYELLGLISFFTVGEDEVRAWTIGNGINAVKAAGKIHSDIERGFIRAEVIGYEDFMNVGGMVKAKEKGMLRLEGKDYIVKDGDIINFRFNV